MTRTDPDQRPEASSSSTAIVRHVSAIGRTHSGRAYSALLRAWHSDWSLKLQKTANQTAPPTFPAISVHSAMLTWELQAEEKKIDRVCMLLLRRPVLGSSVKWSTSKGTPNVCWQDPEPDNISVAGGEHR